MVGSGVAGGGGGLVSGEDTCSDLQLIGACHAEHCLAQLGVVASNASNSNGKQQQRSNSK